MASRKSLAVQQAPVFALAIRIIVNAHTAFVRHVVLLLQRRKF
jgi:hypothetical protein